MWRRVIGLDPFGPCTIISTDSNPLIAIIELLAKRQSSWDIGFRFQNCSQLLHTCKFDPESRMKLFQSWYPVSIPIAYAIIVKELGTTFWLGTWFPASFFLPSTSSFLILSIVSLSFSLRFNFFSIVAWIAGSRV